MISNLRQIKHLYVEQEYLVIYILDSKEVGEGYATAPIVGSLKPCEQITTNIYHSVPHTLSMIIRDCSMFSLVMEKGQ